MVQILGKELGATGFGLMGLTWRENPQPLDESLRTLKAAVSNGLVLWSAAEFYGKPDYNSLTVIKAYFLKYPEDADKVIVAVKGGVKLGSHELDSSAEGTRRSIDNIIGQLGGVKKLDIWIPARRDPKTPLKETFEAAQEYIDTGKLGGVGLSEVGHESLLEGAHAGKVVLVELELSMFTPDILNNGIGAICAKQNIPIVAYSPLCKGMLTGAYTNPSQLEKSIASFPRFQQDAFAHNFKLVEKVKFLAEKMGCTPAQLALSWLRSLSGANGNPIIIPLPGMISAARVVENAKEVQLSEDKVSGIMNLVTGFETLGQRYPPHAPKNT